ncbi:hypothetical protein VP01_2648g3 [Puccinia sorghi]|uniref:F-box domain-containing protein n=1 Tax=Puccinia sorghi TaxID=27349 RepID=A0A0L6V4W7_9BASI|nr:hypothetical protein VP01_2648g3 [Puccinia sorghi]
MAKDSPLTRLFQRGIAAFKANHYPRAIQAFDQALKASSDDSSSLTLKVNILDSRAAAKEKINDLKGSLSDSKKVIDLAPDSPKVHFSSKLIGYIRAARLFNKIHRFPASIKMFELAISRLSSNPTKNSTLIQASLLQENLKTSLMSSSRFASLKKTPVRLLLKSLSLNRLLCPFSARMPFEIFIHIVSCLDIPSRFRCMAVCTSWRQTILNTPKLWDTLSLTGHHQKLMTKAKYWLKRLEPDQQLHTLTIVVSPSWPSLTLHNLLIFLVDMLAKKPFPHGSLQAFNFQQLAAPHASRDVQKNCSDALAFAYSNRESLTTLTIRLPAYLTCPQTLSGFLAAFPSLKTLRLLAEREQPYSFTIFADFPPRPLTSPKPMDTEMEPPDPSTAFGMFLNPASLSAKEQASNLQNQELETLFLQCVSFMPNEGGPVRLSSLRVISLRYTAIASLLYDSNGRYRRDQSQPGIDFTRLPKVEQMDLCAVALGQRSWDPVWRTFQRLPTLKRIRLEGLPHFIPHFLELANVPPDYHPSDYLDEPFKVEMEAILPELELLSLADLDVPRAYKFLAIFGYQFQKLDSLSVSGLPLDPATELLLITAFKHLPPLVNLNLGNTNAKPEVIAAIKADRLEHLQLTNCILVTFRSLERLATPKLQFLDITGCHLISTREMLEWLARRVGSLAWKERESISARRLVLD